VDGSYAGQPFIIDDDGFPNLMINVLNAKLRAGHFSLLTIALRAHLKRGTSEGNPIANVMMWPGEGVDAADRRLSLARSWYAPWKKKLSLAWNVASLKPAIDAILATRQRLLLRRPEHVA
jgi:cholesterol oxidase